MKSIITRFVVPIFLLLIFVGKTSAQVDFLKKMFEPEVFQVTEKLRRYIENELPPVTHDRTAEMKDIDLIFAKGMELSKKQVGTALLAISFAVLNRTDIKPTFPLLGIITLPLPAEDSADAVARINKLPRYIFPDSPQNKWGDSDKLVHFFGSAYLTYETGTKKLPDVIGNLIEQGEVAFKLDTAADPRDVFTNRLGQQFGAALNDGRDVLPSDFLSATYIKK
ncbi:MAG: hypothetical protein M1470_07350 [Bacteroidetes bacterium]|nr:hypothetical protein [Bacteroidota bacterium]